MKTNETHTPGPWFNYIAPHGTRHILPCKQPTLGTVQICTFNGAAHRPHGETEANARLIAASPDMLAALKGIESALNELLFERRLDSTLPEFYQVREARNAARDAIAKATGGTNET